MAASPIVWMRTGNPFAAVAITSERIVCASTVGRPQSPSKRAFAYGSVTQAVCWLDTPSKNCLKPDA